MDKKAVKSLRRGLEDDYWYGEEDEKTFEELVRKAEDWDTYKIRLKDEIKKIERKQPKHGDLLRRDGLVSALGLAMIVEDESGDSEC